MKLYLIGMSGPGSASDLRELIDPIRPFFDGVVWVLHDARESEEATYLESVKGDGAIHHARYCNRHDVSRNLGLYWGPLQDGDWCVGVDVLERISPAFAENTRHVISQLEAARLNAAFYYGKHFMFRYHESLRYQGNPHEGLTRDDGQMRALDLKDYLPTEADVRYGVRATKRPDPFHWVRHYLKYYVSCPWGANHCLLGNVNRGDEMTIFRQRETMRNDFRTELRRRNVGLTVDEVVGYWRRAPLDDAMRRFVETEKILNDGYRYLVFDDQTVIDEHEWTSLKSIPTERGEFLTYPAKSDTISSCA